MLNGSWYVDVDVVAGWCAARHFLRRVFDVIEPTALSTVRLPQVNGAEERRRQLLLKTPSVRRNYVTERRAN